MPNDEKIQISTKNAPSPAGPYSQAIIDGEYIFIAGQRPQDPETGFIPDDIQSQTKQCIRNIESILKEAGATLSDIVKTTVFLSDLKNFAPMNEIYRSMIPEPFPARSTVGVQLRNILIEIEVIAKIKQHV